MLVELDVICRSVCVQFGELYDLRDWKIDAVWLDCLESVALYFEDISNLVDQLGNIKLCEGIVSLACIYVCKTNHNFVAGEENCWLNLEGHGWGMCRRWFCKFWRVKFCLENCVS